MRWYRAVLGGLLVVIGTVWLLQGLRVLPGSFMTGSAFWAVAGLVVAIAGGATVLRSLRRSNGH